MHDYDILVTRSIDCIHGVVDEADDTSNHHYYTVFDIIPHEEQKTSKIYIQTHAEKMEQSNLFRGSIFDDKLLISIKDQQGNLLFKQRLSVGRAFALFGSVRFEKQVDVPCDFKKIHKIAIHYVH